MDEVFEECAEEKKREEKNVGNVNKNRN